MVASHDGGRRIVVLCEGDTEEIAVREFVGRRWKEDRLAPVGLKPINLYGKPQDVGKYASRYLSEAEVLAIFTLIDLQGMTLVRHHPRDELHTKVQRVREWLRTAVTHPRASDLCGHVCVHQIEAWILAEGSALARRLDDPGIRPDPQAESKNFENPPSRRISGLFQKNKARRYSKTIDGRPLFATMQFEPVYNSCQYFRAFYDELCVVARR